MTKGLFSELVWCWPHRISSNCLPDVIGDAMTDGLLRRPFVCVNGVRFVFMLSTCFLPNFVLET